MVGAKFWWSMKLTETIEILLLIYHTCICNEFCFWNIRVCTADFITKVHFAIICSILQKKTLIEPPMCNIFDLLWLPLKLIDLGVAIFGINLCISLWHIRWITNTKTNISVVLLSTATTSHLAQFSNRHLQTLCK